MSRVEVGRPIVACAPKDDAHRWLRNDDRRPMRPRRWAHYGYNRVQEIVSGTPPLRLELPGYGVRQAIMEDLTACDALCRGVHGHDRHGEIAHAIADGTATVVEHNGRITGYATNVGFLAHAIGWTNEELKALIGAASAFMGPGFLLPTRNTELLQWCLNHSLRVVQPMTLMSLGPYQKPSGSFLPSILY